MDMVSALQEAEGLLKDLTTMRVSIYEDNSGELILSETLTPQYILQSKHYAIKTTWFHEEIVKRRIK